MKGRLLDFSVQENTGTISGDDGKRYHFAGSEWKGEGSPARGITVDFDTEGTNAKEVYVALGTTANGGLTSDSPNRLTAGLLALFLGGFGVHKFYLGFRNPGLVYLLTNTIGFAVTMFFLFIPNLILAVMALIEGILYLTKSDEEFERLYVVEKKQWF